MSDEGEDEEHNRLLQSEGVPNERQQQEPQTAASPDNGVGPKQFAFSFLFFLAASAIIVGYFLTPDYNDPQPLSTTADSSSLSDNIILSKNTNDDDDNPWDGEPLFNASFVDYLTTGMKMMLARNNVSEHHHKKQYVYDSPFVKRFPGSEQPYWARKTIPYNKHISSDKQICFVHVGKSGGSTLGCMLGFSLHCDNDNEIKGLLPIVTTHTFHRGVDDCADDAAYYLFVIRDPLARMLSDINYERPNMTNSDPFSHKFRTKELYQDCNFWTLEQLAQNGLMNANRDQRSRKCRARANDAMTGYANHLVHGYFNYQYYTQFVFGTDDNKDASTIPENANLLVIRNNHMVDDWNSINKFIGGQPEALTPSDIPVNNAHAKNATEMYLSDHSKIALCQVLCNEIQVYKNMLRRAKNLNKNNAKESIEELRQVCPKEAVESTCLEERPNMHKKIQRRRGETFK